ncbi:Chitin synthase, class 2 [Datura stramonium]|uniref:chalcone synthase n=1 Tax=Datura stramonium TaxID=4076 RepID=A0ABS8RGH7_DATST|nr:Chitin synthase, class 2 [Datura stramonium]
MLGKKFQLLKCQNLGRRQPKRPSMNGANPNPNPKLPIWSLAPLVDLAENNNKGARILIICSKIHLFCFHTPSETETYVLIGQFLFSNGASAIIVGSDSILTVERPLFEHVFAIQTLLPDCGYAIIGDLNEIGLISKIHKDTAMLISKNIERIIVKAFQPLGISDGNSVFSDFGITGEDLDFGVLFGFGPGLTIEAVILQGVSI